MKRAGLFAVVVAAVLPWSVTALAQEGHVVHGATAKFEPFPNIPPCLKGAVLHGDPGAGPSTLLIRGAAGCRVPLHWHTPNEQVMMASGTARLAMKGKPAETLRPRSYAFVPARHQHEFSCTAACSFFIYADGPFDIHYVDEAGNEIPFEQAVKRRSKK